MLKKIIYDLNIINLKKIIKKMNEKLLLVVIIADLQLLKLKNN